MDTTTKKYKIMVSEQTYTSYYVEAQSPDEAQQIWADNGYEANERITEHDEDSNFTILGIEEVTQ